MLWDDSILSGGVCPAQASNKTTKGILHYSSSTSGVSTRPFSGSQGPCQEPAGTERDTSIPNWPFPASQSRQKLGHGIVMEEHMAGDSPETAIPSWQSHPPAVQQDLGLPITRAERATAQGRCGRISSHQPLVQGGSSDPSKTFHTSPGKMTSLSWWGTVTPSPQHTKSHA